VDAGPTGERAETLVEYLEALPGVAPCPRFVNPATWMLDSLSSGGSGDAEAPKADVRAAFAASALRAGVVSRYARAAGPAAAVFFILAVLMGGGAALAAGASVALAQWVASPGAGLMALYGGLVLASAAVSFARAIAFFDAAATAAAALHTAAVRRVLRAPLSFFEGQTSGRVLNRFSKDVGVLDDALPLVLFDFLNIATAILGTLGIVAAAIRKGDHIASSIAS
jgi:ABC-type multidrug transport system fused ATPase/permease subunit